MAFKIPRIQYSNVDAVTGTTDGSTAVITSIVTTGLQNGMFARGTGIPTGATILSFTSNTVTLSANTAGAGTPSISFGFEIVFSYPPVEPGPETYQSQATITKSLSGVQQTSVNFIEGSRNLTFSFLSQTLFTTLDNWLQTFALLGNTFRYFEDQTSGTYNTYQIKTLQTKPIKRAPAGEDVYVWDYPLDFRRAL